LEHEYCQAPNEVAALQIQQGIAVWKLQRAAGREKRRLSGEVSGRAAGNSSLCECADNMSIVAMARLASSAHAPLPCI